MDILCLSTTDWDEIWGSRQQIMSRLAAGGDRVLFVERQVGPEHLLRDPALRRRKLAAWRQPALRQQGENLWLWQPPLLPPGRYYSFALNRLGQSYLAFRLRPVLERLGFRSPVLYLFPPQSAPLLGQFGEALSVYHCIDRFVAWQQGRKRRVMELQEYELLRRAERVITHSEGLRRLYAPIARRPITLAPSAADVDHFQLNRDVAPEILSLPEPRLGFTGTLDGRMDIELLAGIARRRPAWQIVLIGAPRPGRVDLTPLHGLANVHLLGPRPWAELPALLNGMQALLAPYGIDERTAYISPVKVYEYLAVGKPVISSDLPEVQALQPWVVTAAGPDGFVNQIEAALAADTPELRASRRLAARAHSWEKRVQDIRRTIQEGMEEKRRDAS